MFEYPDEILIAIADFFTAAISGLLPILSILALYFLKNPVAKIGAIISFNALFTVSLMTTAKCRRVEVFAATAT